MADAGRAAGLEERSQKLRADALMLKARRHIERVLETEPPAKRGRNGAA